MKQIREKNTLYVIDTEAYQIVEDTDAEIIYVPEDSYSEYVALNPSLTLTKYNYHTIRVSKHPFIAFYKYENPEFFNLCKAEGWVERDDFMTLKECNSVTDEQLTNIAATRDTGWTSKAKDCKSLEQLQYFTGLTKIPADAFENCKLLKKVALPLNITNIETYAFQNCQKLKSINIPSKVTAIGGYAFQYCYNLDNIKFPSSLTNIGNGAFEYTNLNYIHIPMNVINLEQMGGWNYNLNKITVDKRNTVYNDGNGSNCIIKTNTNELALGCKATKIPNTVKILGMCCFCGINLKTITLPEGLTTIGNSAFYSSQSLEYLVIPSTVTSIDRVAFYYCKNLQYLQLNGTTPPSLTTNALQETSCKIYVPAESVDAYKAANGWKSYASRIEAIPTT